MSVRRRDLFEQIEPPPGGLAWLRARIAEPRHRRWPSLALASVAAAAAVALITIRQTPPDAFREQVVARAGAGAVALGLSAPPAEPVTLAPESEEQAALLRVPTADPRITFYLVGTVQ